MTAPARGRTFGIARTMVAVGWAVYALCALMCLVIAYPPLIFVIAFALVVGAVMALEYFILGVVPRLFSHPRRGWPWSLSTVLIVFVFAPPLLAVSVVLVELWLESMKPRARPAAYPAAGVQHVLSRSIP